MLERLTGNDFRKYGEIIDGGLDDAMRKHGYRLIKHRDVYEKQVLGIYLNKEATTVIDVFNGTAVLYAGLDYTNLQMFLLDKTVSINKGVYFFVAPLLTRATVSFATDGMWPQYIELAPNDRPMGINPSINVDFIYSLKYQEKEIGFKFEGEAHDFWEITYVDKGYIHNVTGKEGERQNITLSQGEIMLFTPGQWHEQYADDGVAPCYVTISYGMDYAEQELFKNFKFKADSSIKKLFEKIENERESMRIHSEDMIKCYLKEIIIRLIRMRKIESLLINAPDTSKDYVEHNICTYVKDYVRQHLHEHISVTHIARQIPVNASYLSTVFKKDVGINLVEYIAKQKLDKAKEYIRLGKHSFTEIASMLSFNSVHYFSKLFKKQYNLTPTEYKRSIKK